MTAIFEDTRELNDSSGIKLARSCLSLAFFVEMIFKICNFMP